jgi:hypothetical protein
MVWRGGEINSAEDALTAKMVEWKPGTYRAANDGGKKVYPGLNTDSPLKLVKVMRSNPSDGENEIGR